MHDPIEPGAGQARDREEVSELASADARGEVVWHTSAPAPADRTELLAGLNHDLGLHG
ncbi:hypothetical protein [Nocardiopsis composta]|uniref:Uncharacterized protein n=1 Tax=Nocardiopsis composta TaxID=157465 RepID=A0A7W8QM78_9ACTN|nr:hypothetical protein [Nocardiopsis composta]MBB5433033.1 hypothetical protein [Nocardiopsis composta]